MAEKNKLSESAVFAKSKLLTKGKRRGDTIEAYTQDMNGGCRCSGCGCCGAPRASTQVSLQVQLNSRSDSRAVVDSYRCGSDF